MNRLQILLVALAAGPAALLVPSAAPAADANMCAGLPVTIAGTPDDDVLTGTPGPDVINGLAGDDRIDGADGDDLVCGGSGTDHLDGGSGDDRVYGERNGLRPNQHRPADNVGDTLTGGAGDDLLDPGLDRKTDVGGGYLPDTISYGGAGAAVRVDLEAGTADGDGTDSLVLAGRIELVGSDHDDVLLGSSREDALVSLGGADLVDGRGADDILVDQPFGQGDEGTPADADRFLGGTGDDYLEPGRGDDVTRGGGGRDQIEDPFGVPDLLAGPGNDEIGASLVLDTADGRIAGGSGRDHLVLVLGKGPELARSTVGRVDLAEGFAKASFDGRTGRAVVTRIDSLVLPEGRWRVGGSRRPELVFGGFLRTSRLVAHLAGGRDRVHGTPGPDLLVGGAGLDSARPGGGVDLCRSIEATPPGDGCEANG
jgi:Ca2+-binding RTX toxin-like protein